MVTFGKPGAGAPKRRTVPFGRTRVSVPCWTVPERNRSKA